MKVLRLIGSLDPSHGGPPVSSLNSCIAAQQAGAETTFAFPVEKEMSGAVSGAIDRLRAAGVDVVTFPSSSWLGKRGRSWGLSGPLARWIGRHKDRFDLIHCHGAWQMVSLLAARDSGKHRQPLLLTPHESLTDFDIRQTRNSLTRPLKCWLRRYFLKRFDLFVVASQLEARDSLPATISESNRVAIIPHAVAESAQAPPRATSDQPLHIGYLGRLHRKKNVGLLIEAISTIEAPVSLTIAGTGPEEKRLRRLALELGINDRISWLGFVDSAQKTEFFRTIDVLALPSDYECFGMAAAEALASGIPVIVSEETGIAEILRHTGGGDIIKPGRRDIERAIRALQDNPDRLADLTRHAGAAAKSALSLSAHGDSLYREYEKLVAAK